MNVTSEQYDALLAPLDANRVASRKQGGMSLSYLEAWDVRAHLIKIFGFGGWSADVLSAEKAFEDQDDKGRWNVGYKVVMRLRLHGPDGDLFGDTSYTEAAVGSATLPQRGEAHDMAIKTGESDALKRCAMNLGTTFGLSLYDSGSRKDVVRETLCPPEDWEAVAPISVEQLSKYVEVICQSVATRELQEIWEQASVEGWLDAALPEGETVRSVIVGRVAAIRGDEDK